MSITVNIYYSGTNGSARKFAEEIMATGTVAAIRSEKGISNMRISILRRILKQSC